MRIFLVTSQLLLFLIFLPACAGGEGKGAGASLPKELQQDLRAELRAEIKKELKAELREEVSEELKRELRAEVSKEVKEATKESQKKQESLNKAKALASQKNDVPKAAASKDVELDDDDKQWLIPGTILAPNSSGIRLVELNVGAAIEDKLLADIESHYARVPEVFYCYSVVNNPREDDTITHIWRRNGRPVSRVELEVGKSPKWRTWSKQRTRAQWTGFWSCEVLDSEGTQLGRHVFQAGPVN